MDSKKAQLSSELAHQIGALVWRIGAASKGEACGWADRTDQPALDDKFTSLTRQLPQVRDDVLLRMGA